jgi:NACHT domain
LAAGLALLLVVLVTTDVARADNVASVLGFAVTAIGAAVALVTWQVRVSKAATAPPTPEQLSQALETLAGLVEQQWRREAEIRVLADPEPMPVSWRPADAALMDHRRLISSRALTLSGRSDRIDQLVTTFRRLRRRRLVILGAAGGGKTTLALQLLLALNQGRQPGEPVPVLLSLTSWSLEDQPRPQDWLVHELARGYPALRAFGTSATTSLVERGLVLPVLDGLDEIPARHRPAVIAALNRSLVDDTGLIVTSRAREYRETVTAASVLTAAAVIETMPLTAAQAASYLTHLLPTEPREGWRRLLADLRAGAAPELAATLTTPLGLWLLRTVYVDTRTDPTVLLDPHRFDTADAVRAHLLDALIPAALATRPPSVGGTEPFRPRRRHRPDQVRRWLTELARHLEASGTSDWAWWRLGEYTSSVSRFRLAIGITCGLLSGAIAGIIATLADGPAFGLAFGMITGGLAGVATGLIARPRNEPAHLDLDVGRRVGTLTTRVVTGMAAGTIVGVLGGLCVGLVIGLTGWHADVWRDLSDGLRFGFTGGLAAGLAEGLAGWARTPGKAQRASSPATSHRGDRALTMLVAAGFGLTVGPGIGFLVAAGSTPAVGLAVGVSTGLAAGLVGGMTGGLTNRVTTGDGNTAWPAFVTAALWLALRRRLPFRLITFLDDAHRLGLLRVVGPVYQFRHSDLQRHLVAGDLTKESSGVLRP